MTVGGGDPRAGSQERMAACLNSRSVVLQRDWVLVALDGRLKLCTIDGDVRAADPARAL